MFPFYFEKMRETAARLRGDLVGREKMLRHESEARVRGAGPGRARGGPRRAGGLVVQRREKSSGFSVLGGVRRGHGMSEEWEGVWAA